MIKRKDVGRLACGYIQQAQELFGGRMCTAVGYLPVRVTERLDTGKGNTVEKILVIRNNERKRKDE